MVGLPRGIDLHLSKIAGQCIRARPTSWRVRLKRAQPVACTRRTATDLVLGDVVELLRAKAHAGMHNILSYVGNICTSPEYATKPANAPATIPHFDKNSSPITEAQRTDYGAAHVLGSPCTRQHDL